MNHKQVTSIHIAEICGVSRGTVDRALNNRPDINAETKEKIQRVAQQLGYRPNHLAKSLVTGQTMSIGLVLFDVNNRIFAQLVQVIEAEARSRGYLVNLLLTHANPTNELESVGYLVERHTDGLIILPVNNHGRLASVIGDTNIPMVAFGNMLSADYPFVWIDDYQAMQDLAQHVVAKGYTRLIYLSPSIALAHDVNIFAQMRRYMGFLDVCNRYPHVTTHIVQHKFYRSEIETLIRSDEKVAILCSSDIYALDVLRFLTDKGVHIPNDVGLAGFDDIDTLQFIRPHLTTVSLPIKEIGQTLVDVAIRQITRTDDEGHTPVLLQHRLVNRESL